MGIDRRRIARAVGGLVLGVQASGCVQHARYFATHPVPFTGRDGAEVARASHVEAPIAVGLDPDPAGPLPIEELVRRALAANPTVQAAALNVQALRHRIPQVTALEDPVASSTIYPIPGVAPQYSLMGYNPYSLLLAQSFPWFGTLRLRGEAADRDAQVALAELCAAQLDVVAEVRRAGHDLAFAQGARSILAESRRLGEGFRDAARARLAAGGSEQDVLQAEVALDDLDREIEAIDLAEAEARVALAEQLDADPEAPLQVTPPAPLSTTDLTGKVDGLVRLAEAVKPELQGRKAAVARDGVAVELARKRYAPNMTLGLSYMLMERTNAEARDTASGVPNVGMFVGLNLPIYRKKLDAAVCEAQLRASADARLLDAERADTRRGIAEGVARLRYQRRLLEILRDGTLPRSRQALDLASAEYRSGGGGLSGVLAAWREVLQIELQAAQVEAELGKALASLERAVGARVVEAPPSPGAIDAAIRPPAPPSEDLPGPFGDEAP